MDSHYQMNGLQTHNLPTAHMNGMAQRRSDGQHDGQTLPPLNGALQYQPYSVGMSQHPTTTTAPYTPTSQGQFGSGLPQLAPQQPHALQQLGGYSQPGAYGSMTQSMMPPSSTAMASNMSSSSSQRLPDLHPRPQDGPALLAQLQQHGVGNSMMVPASGAQEPEPTHVVGQQGRRGILPSAPGRAPGNVRSTVPVKDADGKYPCPHCNKTYQHAKHLKRHLLRHTGDRPYMCKLCKDTFSRSDILKRHFQKCSVRRGVVGDMDHLEGSRAHLQKNRQSVDASQGIQFLNPNSVNPSPVYDNSNVNSLAQLPGSMMGQQPYAETMQPGSARNSRSNSLARPASSFMDNRRSLSALEQISTTRSGTFESYSTFSTPGALPSMLPNGSHAGNMSATQSPVNSLQNGISNGHAYGGFGTPDAAQGVLQQEGQHPFLNQQDRRGPMTSPVPKADVEREQNGLQDMGWSNVCQSRHPSNATLEWVKTELPAESSPHAVSRKTSVHDQGSTAFSGLYTDPTGFDHYEAFNAWQTESALENKLSFTISFCLSYTAPLSTHNSGDTERTLRSLLSVANVQDFLGEFSNYQGHWPMLHMPTFDPTQANDALLLAILCIGAVYSDKIDISQTRWLMELVKEAVHRASPVLAAIHAPSSADETNVVHDTEEIQALLLLQCLFLWHGNQSQRARAREDFPFIATATRRCHLLKPLSAADGFTTSIFHQTNIPISSSDGPWNWSAWIAQEKRSRAFYILYLLDCAMAIYFNASPQIDPTEIDLCLPADDTAWEATTSDECARVLGLTGYGAYHGQEPGAPQSPRQPEMQIVLRSLFNPATPPRFGESNAYSKFIIIHALHSILWTIQRRNPLNAVVAALQGHRSVHGGAIMPERPRIDRSGTASTVVSGTSTPDSFGISSDAFSYDSMGLRGVKIALDKWKRSWDMDSSPHQSPAAMPLQPRERQPRVGFCRDGIYFYYLAIQFYNRTSRSTANAGSPPPPQQDLWQLAPDTRFALVMDLIKRIKRWMSSEQAKSGRDFDLGSMGNIDDNYGVADLTLDMSLLFTRIVPRTPSTI